MRKNLKYIFMSLICILATIIPIKVNANGITLNKSEITLGVGIHEKLNYTLGEGLNSSNIMWKSSNTNVATVQNGEVTAISEGSAIITASINGYNSTCKVVVTSNYISVTGISLNKSSLSILVGTSETLTYTISPQNATNKNVTWQSSDNSVVTVQNGKITAKKVGTATITVSSSEYRAQCRVTVVDTVALKSISLNKTSLTIKEKSSEKLSVTFNPSTATNKKVTWRSSNTNIVTVDSSGNVTAIRPGSATITVVSNDGGYVATCKITVEEISKKVTSVSLDKKELNLVAGEKSTLKVTVNPDYAENKNVTWSSSNESIATVQNGEITAIAPGTTEIKVTSVDGNKEAICKVTVTAPPIKGVSFSESGQTVYLGSEITLNPVTDPVNSILENPIWTSSNEEIATVENGVVKGLSLGETTITVSNQDKSITASITVTVINKPKEKLNITIEGYNLNFNPDVTNYNLTIGDESELTINTNVSKEKVTTKGNQNLKNGSIITITVTDEEKVTYIINIKKKQNYTIYFIAVISVLLLLNLIRIIVKSKKKSF